MAALKGEQALLADEEQTGLCVLRTAPHSVAATGFGLKSNFMCKLGLSNTL